MTAADERLQAFKTILASLRERVGLPLGFVLWDGSTVPADLAPDALAVVFADEGAIAGLVRRPRLDTLSNLWVSKRVDIRNGTLFDLADARPTNKVRTRDFWKTLDKWALAKLAWKFWRTDRGGPWPLEAIPSEQPS